MFKFKKGCLYLVITKDQINTDMLDQVPLEYQEKRKERDGEDYHITVVKSKEMTKEIKLDKPEDINYSILGLSVVNDVCFLVCHYPAADKFRKKHGLESIDFHITLGFKQKDNHTIDKSIKSITEWNKLDHLIANPSVDYKKMLTYLKFAYQLFNTVELAIALAKVYLRTKSYSDLESMLDQICFIDPIEGITMKLKYGEFKNTTNLTDIQNYYDIIKDLNVPMSNEYIVASFNNYDNKNYYYLENNIIQKTKKPRNWGKIIDNIYGSAIVESKYQKFLDHMGIKRIINLIETPTDAQTHHFPIDDRCGADPVYINQIVEIIWSNEDKEPTIVHCLGGKGRTNMILVCYLMKYHKISKHVAIELVSNNRECIITDDQMQAIAKFSEYMYKPNIQIDGKKPKVILCVGYPCSGKSTFCKHIESSSTVRINQDELGKKECLAQFQKNLKNDKIILLDRCNLTKLQRKEWIDLLINQISGKQIWCLLFRTDIDECKYRCKRRSGHESLSKEGGVHIIEGMRGKMEEPLLKEGFKRILEVKSLESINCLLEQWNILPLDIKIDQNLIKFPRTKHIYNLGSASREDLLMTTKEKALFLNTEIVVEEKIDGANMGISIDPDTFEIKIQNRSHFISSAYHAQFKKLDKWISDHQSELYEIIKPGEEILFGEWLFYKHSIHYDNLPDYFIVFDIFDKKSGKFYSRDVLEKKLENTSIPLIKCISRKKIKKIDELLEHIKLKSEYGNHLVEGVYVKIPDGKYICGRGKIVRSDFLSGDVFWAKNEYVQNTIKY